LFVELPFEALAVLRFRWSAHILQKWGNNR